MYISESKTFIAKTIGEGWLEILNHIITKGSNYHDEGRLIKEIIGIRLKVKSPNPNDEIIKAKGKESTIKEFKNTFLGNKKWLKDVDIKENFKEKEAISYSVRIHNFEGFNQYQNVIERISKIPETKRALISTPMPHRDWGLDYLPCIDTIHCLLRENRMNMFIYCRGLDFGQKAYANLVCLAELQKNVSDNIKKRRKEDIRLGELDILIGSAHIYKDTLPLIKEMLNKTK